MNEEILRRNDPVANALYHDSVKSESDKQYDKKGERRVIDGTEQIAAKNMEK